MISFDERHLQLLVVHGGYSLLLALACNSCNIFSLGECF